MKIRITVTSIVAVAAMAASACSASVAGSADAATDVTPTTSTEQEATAEPTTESPEAPADTPAAELPTDDPADEPATNEPAAADDPAAADIDPATLAWADAACLDMVTLFGAYMEAPEPATGPTDEDYAVENINYFDGFATTINDLLADIHDRAEPGIPEGERIHEAYTDFIHAIGVAAQDGAIEMELLHRSGSAADLAAAIEQTQGTVMALVSDDFAAQFDDDAALTAAMEAAMDVAPSCALLG